MGINWKDLFFNLSVHQNQLEGLLKQGPLAPTSGVADSVGLEWGLKIFIANKSSGANATGLRKHTSTEQINTVEACKRFGHSEGGWIKSVQAMMRDSFSGVLKGWIKVHKDTSGWRNETWIKVTFTKFTCS